MRVFADQITYVHNYLLFCSNDDNDNDIFDDVTDTTVSNSEETIDLLVEGNIVIDDDTAPAATQDIITSQSPHDLEAGSCSLEAGSQDHEARSHDHEARSHDHEAGSQDHDITLNAQRDNSELKKLSVNGLSYRKLLEKEELEDCEENTIVMEELSVERSDATAIRKSKRSNFIAKLKFMKDHATSTLVVLLSLLK